MCSESPRGPSVPSARARARLREALGDDSAEAGGWSATFHDDELAEALRRLPTPPHRPSFFAELEDRLGDEWTMPGRTRRVLRSLMRAHGRRALAMAAAAAVIATASVVAAEARRGGGRPRPAAESCSPAPSPPAAGPVPPVTAGSALPPMTTVPAPTLVVEGVRVDASGFDAVHGSWMATFFLTADGRYRRVEAGGAQTVEDSRTGTSQVLTVNGRGRVTLTTETGAAPGPPGRRPRRGERAPASAGLDGAGPGGGRRPGRDHDQIRRPTRLAPGRDGRGRVPPRRPARTPWRPWWTRRRLSRWRSISAGSDALMVAAVAGSSWIHR